MNVLILKTEIDDFEKFISEAISGEGIDVEEPFDAEKVHAHRISFIIADRLRLWSLYQRFLNNWASHLEDYDAIILFDYGFRPSLLDWIKRHNPRSKKIVWLWNVFNSNRSVFYSKADRVFCFDEAYARKNGFAYSPQFHFPEIFSEHPIKDCSVDVSFVGANKGRLSELRHIADELDKNNVSYRFRLAKSKCRHGFVAGDSVEFVNAFIPYREVLEGNYASKAILDLVKPGQTGLTLRVLEALFSQRKLLTNNTEIMNTDLYTKDNVFVIGVDEWSDLTEFLNRPFTPYSESVLERYTFSHWLRSLINS